MRQWWPWGEEKRCESVGQELMRADGTKCPEQEKCCGWTRDASSEKEK